MNECVLVVDDDREIVRAIAVLLEKEGYQVLKAYDGLQALELAVEKPVQLIIMDVMMPRRTVRRHENPGAEKYPNHRPQRQKRGDRQNLRPVHGRR